MFWLFPVYPLIVITLAVSLELIAEVFTLKVKTFVASFETLKFIPDKMMWYRSLESLLKSDDESDLLTRRVSPS